MKRFIAASSLLCAVVLCGPIYAESIVQNDSLGENQSGVVAGAQFEADGEAYEVVYEIPDAWFDTAPNNEIEILGVRVVMVQDPQSVDRHCARFSIEIYSEPVGAPTTSATCRDLLNNPIREKDPGGVIYDLAAGTGGLGFEVEANPNAFQDLRFSAISNNPQLMVTIPPIMVSREDRILRVVLRGLDRQCTLAGLKYPIMLTDMDGVTPQKNYIYGYVEDGGLNFCPNYGHYLWDDFRAWFFQSTPGDWVMRLIVERGNNPPLPDMGMGDDMSTSNDMGGPSDDGGSGGDDMSSGGDDQGNNTGDDQGVSSGALAIESITPDSGFSNASTEVVIVGTGFQQGASVLVGAEAIGVIETKTELIRATIPEGFDPGVYDVIVSNPDGESDSLSEAFTINTPEQEKDGGSEGGCCATAESNPDYGLFVLFGIIAMTLRRRRTK